MCIYLTGWHLTLRCSQPPTSLPYCSRHLSLHLATSQPVSALTTHCHTPHGHHTESVIVSPSGIATMLDKYGAVFEAEEGPDGSYSINRRPRAHLGPGRPLGAGFNTQGDLYVCDALKVFAVLGFCGVENRVRASSQELQWRQQQQQQQQRVRLAKHTALNVSSCATLRVTPCCA